jgi:hypothetical protein
MNKEFFSVQTALDFNTQNTYTLLEKNIAFILTAAKLTNRSIFRCRVCHSLPPRIRCMILRRNTNTATPSAPTTSSTTTIATAATVPPLLLCDCDVESRSAATRSVYVIVFGFLFVVPPLLLLLLLLLLLDGDGGGGDGTSTEMMSTLPPSLVSGGVYTKLRSGSNTADVANRTNVSSARPDGHARDAKYAAGSASASIRTVVSAREGFRRAYE